MERTVEIKWFYNLSSNLPMLRNALSKSPDISDLRAFSMVPLDIFSYSSNMARKWALDREIRISLNLGEKRIDK